MAGIVAAEKSYIESLNALKEVVILMCVLNFVIIDTWIISNTRRIR